MIGEVLFKALFKDHGSLLHMLSMVFVVTKIQLLVGLRPVFFASFSFLNSTFPIMYSLSNTALLGFQFFKKPAHAGSFADGSSCTIQLLWLCF